MTFTAQLCILLVCCYPGCRYLQEDAWELLEVKQYIGHVCFRLHELTLVPCIQSLSQLVECINKNRIWKLKLCTFLVGCYPVYLYIWRILEEPHKGPANTCPLLPVPTC